MSQPWMKFYPTDWRGDPALRMTSLAARGLWLEMLCVMHESEPYGHLRVKGIPVTPKQLALLVGSSLREVSRCLDELKTAQVFDDEDGVILSRRMVRDFKKALRDKENGRSGGNPKLRQREAEGVNPKPNPEDMGEDKAQKPEARSQIPEENNQPPSLTLAAAALPRISDEEIERRSVEATGWTATKGISAIIDHVRAGVDFEDRVLPMLRTIAREHRDMGKAAPVVWAYAVKVLQDPTRRPDADPAKPPALDFFEEGTPEFQALMDGPKGSFFRSILTKHPTTGKPGVYRRKEAA